MLRYPLSVLPIEVYALKSEQKKFRSTARNCLLTGEYAVLFWAFMSLSANTYIIFDISCPFPLHDKSHCRSQGQMPEICTKYGDSCCRVHVTFTWYRTTNGRTAKPRCIALSSIAKNKLIFKDLRVAFRLCVGLDRPWRHWRNPTSTVSSSSGLRSLPGRIFRTLLPVFGVNDAICVARSLGTCPRTCWWSGLLRMVICSRAVKKGKMIKKVNERWPGGGGGDWLKANFYQFTEWKLYELYNHIERLEMTFSQENPSD